MSRRANINLCWISFTLVVIVASVGTLWGYQSQTRIRPSFGDGIERAVVYSGDRCFSRFLMGVLNEDNNSFVIDAPESMKTHINIVEPHRGYPFWSDCHFDRSLTEGNIDTIIAVNDLLMLRISAARIDSEKTKKQSHSLRIYPNGGCELGKMVIDTLWIDYDRDSVITLHPILHARRENPLSQNSIESPKPDRRTHDQIGKMTMITVICDCEEELRYIIGEFQEIGDRCTSNNNQNCQSVLWSDYENRKNERNLLVSGFT